MPKIQHVILHIGLPKTSSTSIQHTLYHNPMPATYAKRYYYPKYWSKNHSYPLVHLVENQEEFKTSILTLPYNDTKDLKNFLEAEHRLKVELEEKTCDTLILSGESVIFFDKENLCRLKQFLFRLCNNSNLRITVVVYTRNPLSYFTSFLQQLSKIALYNPTIFGQLSHICCNYHNELHNFIHAFGIENLKSTPFEKAVKHVYGPVGHFYEKILQFNFAELTEINFFKENIGFSQLAVNFLMIMNKHYPRNTIDYADVLLIGRSLSGNKFKLSKEIRQLLLDKSKNSILFLSNTFQTPYSIKSIKAQIDNDTDPSHDLTDETREEIAKLSTQIGPTARDCINKFILTDQYHLENELIQKELLKCIKDDKSTSYL